MVLFGDPAQPYGRADHLEAASMFPPAANDRMMRDTDLIREARAAAHIIGTRLSAAGFDISVNGLLVLAAIAVNGRWEVDLARELGIAEQDASQIIDTLIQRGYLELLASSDGGGRTGIVTTPQTRAVFTLAVYGIMAARWAEFPFRPGDIVISTLPKSGTTWMQMICALLIFLTPDLPAPLPDLSPWMDSSSSSRDEVYAQLAAQEHRRFIKTHMPLFEIPINSGVTYIVIARHPLDVVASMYHQDSKSESARSGRRNGRPEPDLREWLLEWIDVEPSARAHHNSLPGAMRRLSYVWARRSEPNVVLVHYEDLSTDLEGEMRRLAARLGVTVPDAAWPGLVTAATFKRMRAAAGQLVDSKDPASFFRSGTSGSGRELLTSAELAHYHARAAQMAPPDLLAWLHRDDGPNGARATR